jgi:hypothetical protein
MANNRSRAWFFTTSGDTQIGGFWQRFVSGGISKPTQNTFEDLTQSTAFKTELTDGASDNGLTTNHSSGSPLQGLVTTALDADISNDANVKASYTSNTPIVAKAYQMTAVAEEVQTLDTLNEALVDVTNNGTTRRNYVVKLATAFVTWLGLIRTQLTTAQADIVTLDGRVDTAETDIDTLQSDVTDLQNDFGTIGSSVSGSFTLVNATHFTVTTVSGTPGTFGNIKVSYQTYGNLVNLVFSISTVTGALNHNFYIDINLSTLLASFPTEVGAIIPSANFTSTRTQTGIYTVSNSVNSILYAIEQSGTKTIRLDGLTSGASSGTILYDYSVLTHYIK